jgi:hypothetical protein
MRVSGFSPDFVSGGVLFGVDRRRGGSLACVDQQHVVHLANHLHLLLLRVIGASVKPGCRDGKTTHSRR